MSALHAVVMALVAILGAGVALTRSPVQQSVVMGVYGFALTALFLVLQAPDVALSQAVLGAAYPAMVLFTLGKIGAREK